MTQQITPLTGDSKGYPELEEVDRLIAVATNPRDKAFISLLARTGCRISEAIQVKTSDIDFQRGILFT